MSAEATPSGTEDVRLPGALSGLDPLHLINPVLIAHAEERATSAENRIADRITAFAGSMRFVYIHIIWFTTWIVFGVEGYPYGLLTMIVSLEAIFHPLDTSSPGTKTIHADAVDRAGHQFYGDLTYRVTAYSFTGFFSPIMNLPAVNVVNAGNTVPIKFSLAGFRSFNLFATGYPASQRMTCGGAVTGPLEPTTLGPEGFTYDPLLDQYKWVWKTDRRWMGTCRQLVVRFRDGTEKRANFRFQ
jgi:hypothetical protein